MNVDQGHERIRAVIQVPTLGMNVPRRGNALTRGLGAFGLGLLGWRFEGSVPDRPKMVIIVAPHTSNWDFIVGVCAALALGFRFRFLGKDALFSPPLGWFMRWLGGIPVNRKAPDGVMEAAVESFHDPASFLAITPEGTRRRVERWKTGFWRIAREARVPVWPVAFDWSRRVVALLPPFETSADREADVRALRALFSPSMARRPEDYGVPGSD
jgi:1-acyl-sn-glycerol-3-phosphate acyltransferase